MDQNQIHRSSRVIASRHSLGFLVSSVLLFHLTLIESAPGQAEKIMPLGDSITRGSNDINYPNGDIPGGYRKNLGNRLATANVNYDFVGGRTDNSAPGMDPDHFGVNGIRTDEVLADINSYLAFQPDKVLMMLGTNDVLQGVSIETAVENLESLIVQLTENAPGRRVYVATLPAITGKNWNGQTAAALNENAQQYNVQVRAAVQQHASAGRHVTLVDFANKIVYTDPNNPANNFYKPGDGVHPGQEGYDQMGNIWFDAIQLTYGSWISNYPLLLEFPLEQQHPFGDPNGDGISNLLAYGLGADPLSDNSALLPDLAPAGDAIVFQFRRNVLATDLEYEIQVSPDLSPDSWTPFSQESAISEDLGGDGSVEKISVALPRDLASRFVRLRIIKQ
jgi:acyl-CoA thioesterase I